jgi:hypothetical protein
LSPWSLCCQSSLRRCVLQAMGHLCSCEDLRGGGGGRYSPFCVDMRVCSPRRRRPCTRVPAFFPHIPVCRTQRLRPRTTPTSFVGGFVANNENPYNNMPWLRSVLPSPHLAYEQIAVAKAHMADARVVGQAMELLSKLASGPGIC